MKNYTFKRAVAYIIDMLLVYLFVSLLSGLNFLNPKIEGYNKLYEEYNTLKDEYVTAYNKYMDAQSNDDLDNEYELEKLNNLSEELLDLSYDLSRMSSPTYIINITIIILYFVIFKYYNHGQTLGMKLLKLQLVSDDNKKLSFKQNLVSSLLIYGILTLIASYVFLVFFEKDIYIVASTLIALIDSSIILIALLFMMFRKDGKAIHDIITNTNVISTKDNKIVKEAKHEEKEIKSNNKKKKITKSKKGEKWK